METKQKQVNAEQLEIMLKQMDCIKELIKEKIPTERGTFGYCNCQSTNKLGDAIANAIMDICICPYANEEITSIELTEGKFYAPKCNYFKNITLKKGN